MVLPVPRKILARLIAMGLTSPTDDVPYPVRNLFGTAVATFDDSPLTDDNIAELKECIAPE